MASALSSAIASVLLLLNPTENSSLCQKNCRFSEQGVQLVRTFEGYSPFVYEDSAGLATIGFGHLIRPGEKFVEPLLGEDAERLLIRDLLPAGKGVNSFVTIPLRQAQFDALGSFTFNLGTGSLKSSTLLKRVNENRHDDVPPEFLKWVNAGGKRINGLVARRQAEADYYASAR